MDDLGEVFQGDFLRFPAPESRDGNDLVVLVLTRPGGTEFDLEQFCLLLDDGAAFLDILGDHIPPERDHGSMPDDTILEYGEVGGAPADIDQRHPGFLLFLTQHGIGGSQRLQGDVLQVQARAFDATADIFYGRDLSDHHVEIRLQASPVHADRLLDFGLTVHLVLLRQYMNDFLAGQHDQFVYLVDQLFQVFLPDHFLGIHPGDIVAVLQGADMLSGDTDGHRPDLQARIPLCFLDGLLDGLYGLGDVVDNPAVDPQALGSSDSQNLDLPILIFLADNGNDLGGTNVQSYRILNFFHALSDFSAHHLVVELQADDLVVCQCIIFGGLRIKGLEIVKFLCQVRHIPESDLKIVQAEPEPVIRLIFYMDPNDILVQEGVFVDEFQDFIYVLQAAACNLTRYDGDARGMIR